MVGTEGEERKGEERKRKMRSWVVRDKEEEGRGRGRVTLFPASEAAHCSSLPLLQHINSLMCILWCVSCQGDRPSIHPSDHLSIGTRSLYAERALAAVSTSPCCSSPHLSSRFIDYSTVCGSLSALSRNIPHHSATAFAQALLGFSVDLTISLKLHFTPIDVFAPTLPHKHLLLCLVR